MTGRSQRIVNEAVRLVTVESYAPAPAIITACETVSASPADRRLARTLWAALVRKTQTVILASNPKSK